MIPLGLLLVLDRVLPAAIGGQQQRIAMSNAGHLLRPASTSPTSEVASDHWLGLDRPRRQWPTRGSSPTATSTSGCSRSATTAAPVSDRLFPTLLSDDAYVFVDDQILHEGVSTVFYTGDLLTYSYPLQDLNRHLDLVYSSPDARVYR